MDIKNVVICGLGAVGLTYASKLKDFCDLRIVANQERIDKYKNFKPTLNGKEISLRYILPNDDFKADLIIIATKYNGLNDAINYIKNFVNQNTIILSLINGISSEDILIKELGINHVIHSYFIGHSAVRVNNSVQQDGIGKIVIGTPFLENNQKLDILKVFFENANVDYEVAEDIIRSMWVKLGVNVFLNQPSAILGLTMGEMKRSLEFKKLAKKLVNEVKSVAVVCGVNNLETFEEEVLNSINLMSDDGKSSMYQDILAHRKTEVDIFAGEILKLGRLNGIDTPFNEIVYNMIKIMEEK